MRAKHLSERGRKRHEHISEVSRPCRIEDKSVIISMSIYEDNFHSNLRMIIKSQQSIEKVSKISFPKQIIFTNNLVIDEIKANKSLPNRGCKLYYNQVIC